MKTRLHALFAAAAAMTLAGSLPVAAASPGDDPQPATIHDARGDGRGIDIKKTTISAATDHRVLVATTLYSFGEKKLNASDVWLDTNAKNAGPEWRVLSFRGNDGDGLKSTKLLKVANFRDGGEEKKCNGAKVAYLPHDNLIKTLVPMSCIGRPDRIRYNSITWNFTRYVAGNPTGGVSDYSPKKGKLSEPWRTS